MMVIVKDDDGTEAFSYDTGHTANCLCPGLNEKRAVVAALDEARRFLEPNVGNVLPPTGTSE